MKVRERVQLAMVVLILCTDATVFALPSSSSPVTSENPKSSEDSCRSRLDRIAQVLRDHLASQPNSVNWEVGVSEREHQVSTNWYRTHKGEVELRISIDVGASQTTVTARQRVGLLRLPQTTAWSERQETAVRHLLGEESLLSGCTDTRESR